MKKLSMTILLLMSIIVIAQAQQSAFQGIWIREDQSNVRIEISGNSWSYFSNNVIQGAGTARFSTGRAELLLANGQTYFDFTLLAPGLIENNIIYAYRFRQTQPTPATTPTPTPAPAATPPAPGMVRIQGGTFMMGSPANEPGRESDEGPQRRVTVSSFYMGRYEVTQREYEAVMGTNPSRFFKGPNLPVEFVSWFDAVEYCNRLSQREGLTPAYTISGSADNRTVTWNRRANGYRLPTEAEWEYACRAGTTTPFNTGNNITTNQANYNGNLPYNNNVRGENRQTATDVGSFAPNAWGLYDMHGNVSEWCWDWYGIYPSEAQTDPVGAVTGSNRVRRGGADGSSGQMLRSAYRYYPISMPQFGIMNNGFRLARNGN